MIHGPCCPIHHSTLDSPDYWTDPALMTSAAPASSTEWHRWAIESRSRHAKWASRHSQWQTIPSCFFQGLIKPYLFVVSIFLIEKCLRSCLIVHNRALKYAAISIICLLWVHSKQGFIVFLQRMLRWLSVLSLSMHSFQLCSLSLSIDLSWFFWWTWTFIVEMPLRFRLMT